MRKPYEDDDDDGHTIVDMSQVPRASGLLFGAAPRRRTPAAAPPPARPWEQSEPSRTERLMAVLGALKAGLLIGLAYAVGLGAVILLMLFFWK